MPYAGLMATKQRPPIEPPANPALKPLAPILYTVHSELP
jgi:hypothetical protein